MGQQEHPHIHLGADRVQQRNRIEVAEREIEQQSGSRSGQDHADRAGALIPQNPSAHLPGLRRGTVLPFHSRGGAAFSALLRLCRTPPGLGLPRTLTGGRFFSAGNRTVPAAFGRGRSLAVNRGCGADPPQSPEELGERPNGAILPVLSFVLSLVLLKSRPGRLEKLTDLLLTPLLQRAVLPSGALCRNHLRRAQIPGALRRPSSLRTLRRKIDPRCHRVGGNPLLRAGTFPPRRRLKLAGHPRHPERGRVGRGGGPLRGASPGAGLWELRSLLLPTALLHLGENIIHTVFVGHLLPPLCSI